MELLLIIAIVVIVILLGKNGKKTYREKMREVVEMAYIDKMGFFIQDKELFLHFVRSVTTNDELEAMGTIKVLYEWHLQKKVSKNEMNYIMSKMHADVVADGIDIYLHMQEYIAEQKEIINRAKAGY